MSEIFQVVWLRGVIPSTATARNSVWCRLADSYIVVNVWTLNPLLPSYPQCVVPSFAMSTRTFHNRIELTWARGNRSGGVMRISRGRLKRGYVIDGERYPLCLTADRLIPRVKARAEL